MRRALLVVASLSTCACSADPEPLGHVEERVVRACDDVDPYKELVIVDPTLASESHFSFAYAFANMAPPGVDPGDFVAAWLREIATVATINGYTAAPRDAASVEAFLAAWPKTPDDKLDLARAPFTLLAVSNRIDKRTAKKPNGEARFVYGIPGQPFTVIVEYAPPTGKHGGVLDWARAWHDLGDYSFANGSYVAHLRQLTDDFATAASLLQVRTNENVLGPGWQMRELHLGADGILHAAPLEQQPDRSLNGTATLASWVQANEADIVAQTALFPAQFLGGVIDETPGLSWTLGDTPEPLRKAFAKQTCDGCHVTEAPSRDGFFHVSPLAIAGADGTGVLSPFLVTTALPSRAAGLAALVCGKDDGHPKKPGGPAD